MKQCVSKHRVVPTVEPDLKACERVLYGVVCGLCALILLISIGGCDTGTPKTQIPGVLQSAPPLAEFDANNNYVPYYRTGEMNTPRYMHRAIAHSSGLIWALGGSDERGLSSLEITSFAAPVRASCLSTGRQILPRRRRCN